MSSLTGGSRRPCYHFGSRRIGPGCPSYQLGLQTCEPPESLSFGTGLGLAGPTAAPSLGGMSATEHLRSGDPPASSRAGVCLRSLLGFASPPNDEFPFLNYEVKTI